ncbi:hypothetical protein A6R68_11605, partial [Neotoma lepida]
FIQDAVSIKRNHKVVVMDLCFGEVPVRLFQPKATSSSPRRVIIFYHGGGAVLGSLGKKHPGVMGQEIWAQVLIYPVLQTINFQLPSLLQNQNVPFLTRDFMMTSLLRFRNKIQPLEFPGPFNKSAYLEAKHFLGTRVSPLVADNEVIVQLPEALLVSIHWDILRDDILLYKKHLEDRRVPVTWYNVEVGFHGCMLLFDKKSFSFLCSWNIINAISTMVFLMELLLAPVCLLVLGVNVWVLIDHLLTIDVPPTIMHPTKLRILHYFFHLIITWGNILEKMNICSMPYFVCFIQDRFVSKKNLGVFVKDLRFGTVPVRLFQPKAASSKPRRGIIFIHGGGAVLGSLDSYHNLCAFLARETDSVLLSVGYRKLPYNHHPSSLYDCLSASIHFLKSLKAYGVDPSRVVICGDSIGGTATVVITQTLVGREDLPKIRAQILIYPILQSLYFQFPSNLQNANFPFLTKDFMINCLCRYLAIDPSWKDAILTGACMPPSAWKKYEKWLSPDNIPKMFRSKYQQPESLAPFNEAAYLETKHTMNVDISPLIADDKIIAQVPEAFVVTLQWDILRDDALLYKKRLEDQGVPVTWYHADGFHGCAILFDKKFFSFPCSLDVRNEWQAMNGSPPHPDGWSLREAAGEHQAKAGGLFLGQNREVAVQLGGREGPPWAVAWCKQPQGNEPKPWVSGSGGGGELEAHFSTMRYKAQRTDL